MCDKLLPITGMETLSGRVEEEGFGYPEVLLILKCLVYKTLHYSLCNHLVSRSYDTPIPFHPKWPNTAQKATIHQVTTMLATSENVLFPGHNHLLIISTDGLTL